MNAVAAETKRLSAQDMLHAYSKTWSAPIDGLPPRLHEAMISAYLCLRAIDEIEDHPDLNTPTKVELLRRVSRLFQLPVAEWDFVDAFKGYEDRLPEVSLRLQEWALLAPAEIAPCVWETTSNMAYRMAGWAEHDWRIKTKRDLDEYTYAVAGALGLTLSDFWSWFDHTDTHRAYAISYARVLQTANMIKDRPTDAHRGVDFWPVGWGLDEMLAYINNEIAAAAAYVDMLPREGPAYAFCKPPLRRVQQAIGQLALSDHRSNPKSVSLF
jgi:farnesyl-diphosphate farnesyltransferase